MGMIRMALPVVTLCALAALAAPHAAQASDEEAAHDARWKQLRQAIFGDRRIADGRGVIELDAPERALDAALVPVALRLTGDTPIESLYLIIDNNPGPLAAHVTFGPRADPSTLKLRVRVNTYTYMHAVAESRDGELFATEKFVKAAGGCSAPAGPDDEAALRDIGLMKLRPLGRSTVGGPMQVQLMIRHPNFNGMQMNQITRHITPARFIRTIDATYDGDRVLHLESDISLSTDPVITFGLRPEERGTLKVVARDSSGATFDRSFEIPAS